MKTTTIAIIGTLAILAASVAFHNLAPKDIDSVPEHIIHAFNKWSSKRTRLYGSPTELNYRLKVFHENYKIVKEYNEKKTSATFALNDFADLTKEEFAARYLQPVVSQDSYDSGNALESPIRAEQGLSQQIDNVDWRGRGCNTGIYTQGNCAAGYAIAAANSITYAWIANKGQSASQTSAQEIVDCSKGYGNSGCSGGYTNKAYDYVYYNGLSFEQAYGYTGSESGRCRGQSKGQFNIANYYKISRNDNDRLKAAVKQQPITVAVDASTWTYYNSGVYNGNNCSESKISHFVTVVGYGTQGGYNYWLIENSWGSGWGENGYVRLYRSVGTSSYPCGVSSNAFYPYFQ